MKCLLFVYDKNKLEFMYQRCVSGKRTHNISLTILFIAI